MVDFGEDLIIVDSYRIPWLIWIQMLVFFLLLLLLYAFSIFSPDLSDNNSSSSSSATASTSVASVPRFYLGDSLPANRGSKVIANSRVVQSNQMGGSQSVRVEIRPIANATRRVVRGENAEEEEEEEGSKRKLHHPCNLFQLAGSAFLKCLGLDRTTTTDDSGRPDSKKQR